MTGNGTYNYSNATDEAEPTAEPSAAKGQGKDVSEDAGPRGNC